MLDVVALGELLIDFAPHSVNEEGYPTLAANPGGAPGNFLAALSRYGFSTAILDARDTQALSPAPNLCYNAKYIERLFPNACVAAIPI